MNSAMKSSEPCAEMCLHLQLPVDLVQTMGQLTSHQSVSQAALLQGGEKISIVVQREDSIIDVIFKGHKESLLQQQLQDRWKCSVESVTAPVEEEEGRQEIPSQVPAGRDSEGEAEKVLQGIGTVTAAQVEDQKFAVFAPMRRSARIRCKSALGLLDRRIQSKFEATEAVLDTGCLGSEALGTEQVEGPTGDSVHATASDPDDLTVGSGQEKTHSCTDNAVLKEEAVECVYDSQSLPDPCMKLPVEEEEEKSCSVEKSPEDEQCKDVKNLDPARSDACPKCGKTFYKPGSLLNHVKILHVSDPDFKKTLQEVTIHRPNKTRFNNNALHCKTELLRRSPRGKSGHTTPLPKPNQKAECFLCGAVLQSTYNLPAHVKKMHRCEWQDYTNVSQMKEGVTKEKAKVELLQNAEQGLREYNERKAERKDYKTVWICPKCARSYKFSKSLLTHVNSKHRCDANIADIRMRVENEIENFYKVNRSSKPSVQSGAITCPYCQSERFSCRMLRHLHEHHSGEVGFQDVFLQVKQQIAEKRAKAQVLYKSQAYPKRKQPDRKWTCPHCAKVYSHQPTLCVHVRYQCARNPNRIVKHMCSQCHATCDSAQTLQEHRQKHRLQKYICDQCGKVYASSSGLCQHKRYVHGIAGKVSLSEYVCKVCGKTLPHKSHLRKHMTSHSVERHFPCETCGKLFKHPDSVSRHVQEVHLQQLRHICPKCGYKTNKRAALVRHKCDLYRARRGRQAVQPSDVVFSSDIVTLHHLSSYDESLLKREEAPPSFVQGTQLAQAILSISAEASAAAADDDFKREHVVEEDLVHAEGDLAVEQMDADLVDIGPQSAADVEGALSMVSLAGVQTPVVQHLIVVDAEGHCMEDCNIQLAEFITVDNGAFADI